jgi:hypothetical protein
MRQPVWLPLRHGPFFQHHDGFTTEALAAAAQWRGKLRTKSPLAPLSQRGACSLCDNLR